MCLLYFLGDNRRNNPAISSSFLRVEHHYRVTVRNLTQRRKDAKHLEKQLIRPHQDGLHRTSSQINPLCLCVFASWREYSAQ